MRSTAIADQRVYAQDTEPTDTRDGILWVDTSVSPRETFVYSTDTDSWEPTQVSDHDQLNNVLPDQHHAPNLDLSTAVEVTSDTFTLTLDGNDSHETQIDVNGDAHTMFARLTQPGENVREGQIEQYRSQNGGVIYDGIRIRPVPFSTGLQVPVLTNGFAYFTTTSRDLGGGTGEFTIEVYQIPPGE